LRAIGRQADRFDAVVIIRGGGSRIDLAVFDEAEICRAAAACPLPVLVGIGHETDETLLDRVAWQALKTPTAVAEWLLARSLRCDAALADTALQLQQWTQRHLRLRSQDIDRAQLRLRSLSHFALRQQAARLDRMGADWPRWARRQLKTATRELDYLGRLEQLLSLESQLGRGFALVLHQGRIVKNWEDLPSDALLTLYTAAGRAIVKRVEP
jgi:exodeoxyribonuclease VII large subunit